MMKSLQPPSPTGNCDDCGLHDWCWNEDKNQWECICGSTHYISEVNIDEWIIQTLKEYDKVRKELQESREAPQNGEASKILWTARVNRAERNVAVATIKADAASLVKEMKESCKHGSIKLDLPEAKLTIETKW